MNVFGYYIRLRSFVKGKTLRPLKSEIPTQGYQRSDGEWAERRKRPRYHFKRHYRQYELTAAEKLLFDGWDELYSH